MPISAVSGEVVREGIMSRLILIGRYLRSLAATFSAAQAVSAAVEAQRQPSARALKILGIDPDQFRTIRFR